MKRTQRLFAVLVLAAGLIVLSSGRGARVHAQDQCCGQNGALCNSSSDCCSGLLCDTSWQECVTCIELGDGYCQSMSDCCSGTYCDLGSGTCQTIQ